MHARPATARPALLAATSLVATACDSPLSCDEADCQSGPNIQFTDSTFADGEWRLELLDGERTLGTCTITLPAEPSRTDCDGPFSLTLTPDGTALDTIYPQASGDSPADRPSPLTIRVSHDDTLQTEHTLEPTYETVRPNSESCPPTCHQAEVEVRVSGGS